MLTLRHRESPWVEEGPSYYTAERMTARTLKGTGYLGILVARFRSNFFSDKYENHSSKAAAAANAKATHSAALLPTDQDDIAARPHRNPLGRQTQAIRRVRVSKTEARTGLCFVLHHKGYRIPILTPNDATITSICSGET